ncbi:MAG: PQQ-binding-like beta-propeller repeat protein, partial [bacterium]|nr:PQQ-binding-like beta-propeller repeat protein [bacterium]
MTIFRLLLAACLAVTLSAENWPGFRGPTRQGVSSEKGLPTTWSATENIAWKTAIPGEGWSSPIVWGDRIFLTMTTNGGTSCHVLSLDRKSGKILWDREVFQQQVGKKRKKNSFATPTAITDGKRVYTVFYDASFAALDFSGNVVWTKRDIDFYSEHGLGASPILHDNLLIMPFDGNSPENTQVGWKIPWEAARILALETATGKVRWSAKRGPSRLGHVTPNVMETDGAPLLVSAAGDAIQGHNLKTGELLWSAYSKGEGVVPAIVVGD